MVIGFFNSLNADGSDSDNNFETLCYKLDTVFSSSSASSSSSLAASSSSSLAASSSSSLGASSSLERPQMTKSYSEALRRKKIDEGKMDEYKKGGQRCGDCDKYRYNSSNEIIKKNDFEWHHDFIIQRISDTLSTNRYSTFYDNGDIFDTVEAGWESIQHAVGNSNKGDDLGTQIYEELASAKKKDEPTYFLTVLKAIRALCPELFAQINYVPIWSLVYSPIYIAGEKFEDYKKSPEGLADGAERNKIGYLEYVNGKKKVEQSERFFQEMNTTYPGSKFMKPKNTIPGGAEILTLSELARNCGISQPVIDSLGVNQNKLVIDKGNTHI